jgi:hypothetical protein
VLDAPSYRQGIRNKKTLAPARFFNYVDWWASEHSNASHPFARMRPQVPRSRCKYPRCTTATGRWIFAFLVICIAIAISWTLLLEDYKSVHRNDEYSIAAREETSRARFNGFAFIDQSSEYLSHRTPGPVANASDSKSDSLNPRLSSSGFNAALAAGLVDPSRIEFAEPVIPGLYPAREQTISLHGPGVSFQNPAPAMESGAPLVTATPVTSATANPIEPSDAISSLALAMNKIVSMPQRQSAGAETGHTIPASDHSKGALPKSKPSSIRFISGAGINSAGTSSARGGRLRTISSPSGAKTESFTGRKKTDGHDSPSRDLSDNLQRFASDFIRANQTDSIAEQHRFFADSVHFYSEGDLSLAGVAAATRRHYRDEQTKRSEVAGPAVATGPVNGGFFMIEQPVRWSKSQGLKVTKGRSVLQLRVVPIDHGGWKITSIAEVKK